MSQENKKKRDKVRLIVAACLAMCPAVIKLMDELTASDVSKLNNKELIDYLLNEDIDILEFNGIANKAEEFINNLDEQSKIAFLNEASEL